ncbi:cytochrome c class I [Chondrocystis sp. NIES-4102]|nr:cytochrome c class I [Chondrocystis sp. NIES-4102]
MIARNGVFDWILRILRGETMLSKLLSTFLIFITAAMFVLATPALAGDAANGAKIFSANCAACHAGGNNVVNAAKTLKQEALEKYEMNSIEAITTQVTNGKNAMPAFKGRLTDAQIEDVATYVLSQAEKGW